jgi:integrase/recombinase XerD
LHPAFAESIAAAKVSTNMTFLLTEFGKPFTANGFGNEFKDWCRQADLPHCSAHGVRRATSTALAEAGATPHEIMAVTAHQTLEEVERYTEVPQAARKRPTQQWRNWRDEAALIHLSICGPRRPA